MGIAMVAAAIIIGKSFVYFGLFLAFSIIMTLVWKKIPRPWISLVSVSAATPIAIAKQQFSCNLIFALWFTIFNMKYLSKLPRWIYVLTSMALCGIAISSVSWMGTDIVKGIMRQGAYALNFVLGPFIFLPIIYCRMEKSKDVTANLWGLLYCLIVPTTLILLAAKLFGSVSNSYEASLHFGSQSEGYLQYKLVKVLVSFQRTEIGFVLAALICAAFAITVSKVRTKYRLLAGACLVANIYFLLVTVSFGSIVACICGLSAILFAQLRIVNVGKLFMSIAAGVCLLILTYSFSPQSVKGYMEKRIEFRAKQGERQDRFIMWGRGVDYILEHPEGIGFTLSLPDGSVVHNDYLAYTVSYSFMGGLAYISLVAGLLISFFKMRKRMSIDPCAFATYLAGFGVIVAATVNSMTDHMTANRWYFNLIWSVIWYSYFCSRAAQAGSVKVEMRNKTVFAEKSPCH